MKRPVSVTVICPECSSSVSFDLAHRPDNPFSMVPAHQGLPWKGEETCSCGWNFDMELGVWREGPTMTTVGEG